MRPGMTVVCEIRGAALLSVIGQRFRAGLAEPGTVLLQARQHDLVAVIHLGTAKTRDIPHTGIMPLLPLLLLRRSSRGHQNKRNDKKEPGHLIVPSYPSMKVIKFCCTADVNASHQRRNGLAQHRINPLK